MRELARTRDHEQDTTEKNGARQNSEFFETVLIVKGSTVQGILRAFATSLAEKGKAGHRGRRARQ